MYILKFHATVIYYNLPDFLLKVYINNVKKSFCLTPMIIVHDTIMKILTNHIRQRQHTRLGSTCTLSIELDPHNQIQLRKSLNSLLTSDYFVTIERVQ